MKMFRLLSVSKTAKSVIFCAAALLSFSLLEAREVSVYLTGKKFGQGLTINADSGTRKIRAATQYSYDLTGTIRGEAGKPTGLLIKGEMDLAKFVNQISPGGSAFLSGTFANPSGTLPITVLDRSFSGTRNVKGFGPVSVSFNVVGKILTDGQCVVEVTNVKLKSTPKRKLGTIVFMRGSTLSISTVP